MGYTKSRDPFVSIGIFPREYLLGSNSRAFLIMQVGPVTDKSLSDDESLKFKGQFISAGYTGHGMPRAFAWYVLYRVNATIDAICNPFGNV